MPRHTEGPWFNATKDTWYCTHQGKNRSLQIRGVRNERAAWAAFEALMAPAQGPTLHELFARFIATVRSRRKPRTATLYADDVGSFLGWESMGGKRAGEVRPSDIQSWADALEVSDTTRAMRIRSVGAFFGWVVKEGGLDTNPVKLVVKPKSRKRGAEAVLKPGVYEALLAAASPLFRNVLRFLWATGCRPGEVGEVTADSFNPATRTVTVHEHKSDRTGHARTLFLDEDTAALVADLCRQHPRGAIFRTYQGNPWSGRSVTKGMQLTVKRAGVKAISYGLRHTFGTEALLAGLSDAQVAAMMGHSTTATLHAHYSHVTAKARQLSEAAEELRKKRAG